MGEIKRTTFVTTINGEPTELLTKLENVYSPEGKSLPELLTELESKQLTREDVRDMIMQAIAEATASDSAVETVLNGALPTEG